MKRSDKLVAEYVAKSLYFDRMRIEGIVRRHAELARYNEKVMEARARDDEA